jgi:TolA-binding protein
MHKYLLPLVLWFTIFSFHKAQTFSNDGIDSQFRLGVNMFDSGEYDKALVVFNKIISEYNYNSKTTASEFFKGKILFKQEKFPEAKKHLNAFIEKYPNSGYKDEINILLIKYNLEMANYYNAFKESALLIDLANSTEYKNKAKVISESIALNYLNEIQLQRLYDSFTDNNLRAFILLQMGKVLLKSNDVFGAKSVFNDLMSQYPTSEEYYEAKRLVEMPFDNSSTTSTNVVIGVMLPLEANSTGEYSSATSVEILEGIKYALHEFNKTREEKIGLLVRDTKGDVDEIKNILEQFYSISAVRAVLGPIYSNEVRATFKEADFINFPIISPTATDDDLTELSENFFQANPSFQSMAIRLF